MKNINWKSFATSFTATTFLVIALSGVMLYLHFFNKNIKELHEILGLLFVAATLFHIFYNWKAMKNYFGKKVFIFSVILIGSLSSIFILDNVTQQQANPKALIINSVLNAPLKSSFSLLNIDYETAKIKLAKKMVDITKAQSIHELAKNNNKSPFEIITILKSKD